MSMTKRDSLDGCGSKAGRADEAYDNYKDQLADDHIGIYDEGDEAIERRGDAASDVKGNVTRG